MKRTIAWMLVLSVALLVGCSKKNKTDAEAPPPDDTTYAPPPESGAYGGGATAGGGTYTIQRGDTLWSIAQRTYGDGKRWQDIQAANPGLEPTKLRVGQTITLP